MYVSCERQKDLRWNSIREECRNHAAWKYLKEDKLATVLAIFIVHDVQQLQFPMKLMNEQSWVILKMSLKVANCIKSFHQIWNFLTSLFPLCWLITFSLQLWHLQTDFQKYFSEHENKMQEETLKRKFGKKPDLPCCKPQLLFHRL